MGKIRLYRPFFFFRGGGASAPVQKSVICFMPSFIIVAACRFAIAVARLRAEPATALAPLNHMLNKGFFFSQGFFIGIS